MNAKKMLKLLDQVANGAPIPEVRIVCDTVLGLLYAQDRELLTAMAHQAAAMAQLGMESVNLEENERIARAVLCGEGAE
jgi:hypothetical protein